MEQQQYYQLPSYELKGDSLFLLGFWTHENLSHIEKILATFSLQQLQMIQYIDGQGLQRIDTSGLWLLQNSFHQHNIALPAIGNVNEQIMSLWQTLLELPVDKKEKNHQQFFLYRLFSAIGITSHQVVEELYDIFAFTGRLFATFGRLVRNPSRLRISSISAQIYYVGVKAIGIITLIAFSIAIVVGLLGLLQLRLYGVEELTVTLVAFGILREMGVLLTAIMVAGRTGSAYAAELGLMNVNQETDALETMGLDIFEVLVVPRMLAVIISLTLLTIIADVVGLVADLAIALLILEQTPRAFFNTITQLPLLKYFFVGIIRAPFYGWVIGLTACRLGLSVKGSAQELGRNTTTSVVQSIFIVIFLHAGFSLLFQMLGI